MQARSSSTAPDAPATDDIAADDTPTINATTNNLRMRMVRFPSLLNMNREAMIPTDRTSNKCKYETNQRQCFSEGNT
ncbi:unannotated protein [freshwater metagenome]|uniref:Unannotated protein n=1 Tax=freshwater metagenome TaxID=449393 RepID=A0A6J6SDZ4_9ZZZZ